MTGERLALGLRRGEAARESIARPARPHHHGRHADEEQRQRAGSEHVPVEDQRHGEALSDLAESPPWQGGTPTVELDEMELNQLRALGYMVP